MNLQIERTTEGPFDQEWFNIRDLDTGEVVVGYRLIKEVLAWSQGFKFAMEEVSRNTS